METMKVFAIVFYLVKGIVSMSTSKLSFTKVNHLNGWPFSYYKIFTNEVGDYNDCLLLCIKYAECLSVVHTIESNGQETCTGYLVVFPDDSSAIHSAIHDEKATYYAVKRRECISPYAHSISSNFCIRVLNDIAPVLNWIDAYYVCNLVGGWLALIDTKDKQALVAEYLSTPGVQDSSYNHSLGYFFGGVKVSEDLWVWSGTFDTPLNPVHWKPGEPPFNGNTNRCIILDGHAPYFWMDSDCDGERYFLCEIPAY